MKSGTCAIPRPASAALISASPLLTVSRPPTRTCRSSPDGAAQPPEVAAGEVRIVQQAVLVQVVDRARRAGLGEIGRRRHDHAARLGELAGLERAVGQRADPDREVVALGDQLDEPVLEHHVDVDLRVGAEEGRHRRRHLPDPEGDRRRDPQRALRRRLHRGHHAVGLPGLRQHRAGPVVVGEPDLGRADPPRRAVEEPHRQPRLERGDMLGDRRLRQAELARRLGEAAVVDDLHESLHLGKAVHRGLRHCCSTATIGAIARDRQPRAGVAKNSATSTVIPGGCSRPDMLDPFRRHFDDDTPGKFVAPARLRHRPVR